MDDCDLTSERMEKEEDARRRAQSRYTGPEATGECLWCGAPLANAHRWCDAGCARDWEHEQRMRKIEGRQ